MATSSDDTANRPRSKSSGSTPSPTKEQPKQASSAPIFSVTLPDGATTCSVRPWRFSDVPQLASFDMTAMDRGYITPNLNTSPNPLRNAFTHVSETLKYSYWATTDDGQVVPQQYAVEYQEKDSPKETIGNIEIDGSIVSEPHVFTTAQVAYFIHQNFWGKGVASSVLRRFSSWVFETFHNINRIEGFVPVHWAPASVRVLEKAGFTKFGRATQEAWKEDLGWTDTVMLELLREAWKARKAS